MNLNDIKVESDAEKILLIRRRCNLTQFQFAERLGISKNLIILIESGNYGISRKTRRKIERFLKEEYYLLTDNKEV